MPQTHGSVSAAWLPWQSKRSLASWLRHFWHNLRGGRLALLFESRIAVAGLSMVVFWIVVAALASLLAPYPPNATSAHLNQPPSQEHLMGTDHLGRDVLSRLLCGSRPIMVLAPMSVLCAMAAGITLGLVAAFSGGLVDELVMRFLDAVMAFPTLLLYMIIIAAIGASRLNVVLAITVGSTPGIARIVRSLALEVREREFVQAARLRGESSLYIMFREILPNCLGPLVVDGCLRIGYAAFAIGSLGFLGLGLPPPDPDWGRMVAEGRAWIVTAPWVVLFPSLAISSLVVGLNMLADGMNEASQRM
jgi:peptide/nickel transport system permease protein